MARAGQRWTHEPESGPARLAADYAFGICGGHPFRDGNKRILSPADPRISSYTRTMFRRVRNVVDEVVQRGARLLAKIEEDAAPLLVAQRCVPEQLLRTHLEAPRVDLTHLGYRDRIKMSVSSINDFIVLESGE